MKKSLVALLLLCGVIIFSYSTLRAEGVISNGVLGSKREMSKNNIQLVSERQNQTNNGDQQKVIELRKKLIDFLTDNNVAFGKHCGNCGAARYCCMAQQFNSEEAISTISDKATYRLSCRDEATCSSGEVNNTYSWEWRIYYDSASSSVKLCMNDNYHYSNLRNISDDSDNVCVDFGISFEDLTAVANIQ